MKPPVSDGKTETIGAVPRVQGLLIRAERPSLAVQRQSGPGARPLCDDMNEPAHRPRAVQVRRASGHDFHPVDFVRDQAPIDPPSKPVVERYAIEQDECPPGAESIDGDGLRRGVVVPAAQRGWLYAGHRTQ